MSSHGKEPLTDGFRQILLHILLTAWTCLIILINFNGFKGWNVEVISADTTDVFYLPYDCSLIYQLQGGTQYQA